MHPQEDALIEGDGIYRIHVEDLKLEEYKCVRMKEMKEMSDT